MTNFFSDLLMFASAFLTMVFLFCAFSSVLVAVYTLIHASKRDHFLMGFLNAGIFFIVAAISFPLTCFVQSICKIS